MGEERQRVRIFEPGPALAAAGVLMLAILGALMLYNILYPYGLGQVQPIPFSHRVHVHVKHLSCVMCHTEVTYSARAGIPPLQTCMLCHERIITTFPWIVKLKKHYAAGKPVVWQRVNWVPEFVYFNHSMHVQRGIDCGRCHGNVTMMDRVVPAQKFQMGFCIECHRDNSATHDCLGCHR